VIAALALELPAGNGAQLVVEQRKHFPRRLRISCGESPNKPI
jgi:hypothetical protein